MSQSRFGSITGADPIEAIAPVVAGTARRSLVPVKTDGEFIMCIEQWQQEIHKIVQRSTWQMATILVVWQASMFLVLLFAMKR